MSGQVIFDGAPERGTINFSVGQPSADLLPLALLGSAGERFFAGAEPLELNYGQRQGDARFRAALASPSSESPRAARWTRTRLVPTGGISQALDFVCGRSRSRAISSSSRNQTIPIRSRSFATTGSRSSTSWSTAPAWTSRLSSACSCNTPQSSCTRSRLSTTRPARRSTSTPPSDWSSGPDGFVIVADEVYQLLHHGAPPPSSARSGGRARRSRSAPSRRSFAPGLRLGWIQTTPEFMKTLLASGALVSGGNFNHFTSHVVRQLIDGQLPAGAPVRRTMPSGRRPWTRRSASTYPASRAGKARRRLFLLARAAGGRGCRGARGRCPRGRHRLPAGSRVLHFRRLETLFAPVLRALHRARDPRRHRAPEAGFSPMTDANHRHTRDCHEARAGLARGKALFAAEQAREILKVVPKSRTGGLPAR